MQILAARPVTHDPFIKACKLYASALLYDSASELQRQETILSIAEAGCDMEYDSALIEKMFLMANAFVSDWKIVAQESAPWQEKGIFERIQQMEDVFALNDKTHKPQFFRKPYPTLIVRNKGGAIMNAERKDGTDILGVNLKTMKKSEVFVMSGNVHEEGHFLVRDFYEDEWDMCSNAAIRAFILLKEEAEDFARLHPHASDNAQWEHGVAHMTQIIAEATDPAIVPPVQLLHAAASHIEGRDKKVKFYAYSPEEALVRTAQVYAVTAFKGNYNDSVHAIKAAWRNQVRDLPYNKFAACGQFMRYAKAQLA